MKVTLELTDEQKKQYGIPVSERWYVNKEVDDHAVENLVTETTVLYDANAEA